MCCKYSEMINFILELFEILGRIMFKKPTHSSECHEVLQKLRRCVILEHVSWSRWREVMTRLALFLDGAQVPLRFGSRTSVWLWRVLWTLVRPGWVIKKASGGFSSLSVALVLAWAVTEIPDIIPLDCSLCRGSDAAGEALALVWLVAALHLLIAPLCSSHDVCWSSVLFTDGEMWETLKAKTVTSVSQFCCTGLASIHPSISSLFTVGLLACVCHVTDQTV